MAGRAEDARACLSTVCRHSDGPTLCLGEGVCSLSGPAAPSSVEGGCPRVPSRISAECKCCSQLEPFAYSITWWHAKREAVTSCTDPPCLGDVMGTPSAGLSAGAPHAGEGSGRGSAWMARHATAGTSGSWNVESRPCDGAWRRPHSPASRPSHPSHDPHPHAEPETAWRGRSEKRSHNVSGHLGFSWICFSLQMCTTCHRFFDTSSRGRRFRTERRPHAHWGGRRRVCPAGHHLRPAADGVPQVRRR